MDRRGAPSQPTHLSPDGSVGIYTKRRLGAFSESARRDGSIPPPEPSVFVPGTLDPQVELETGPAALAICADIGDPAHPQLASDAGAAHYLASMFVIPSELDADLARLSGYAQRFGWLVGFANFVGHSGGLAAAGSSAFWGPDGALLVQLPKGDAGLAMAWKSPEGWRGRRLD
ncbi:MAG: nitrilase-related carbon-nitrogen hydrolase [Polyangiaceae bacterium]